MSGTEYTLIVAIIVYLLEMLDELISFPMCLTDKPSKQQQQQQKASTRKKL